MDYDSLNNSNSKRNRSEEQKVQFINPLVDILNQDEKEEEAKERKEADQYLQNTLKKITGDIEEF